MKAYAICALGFGFCLAGLAADTKLAVDRLPAAVLTAAKEHAGGATILGASTEKEHGRTTYEVETKQDGKSRDLTFDEKGSLLEVEQEVDLDSLPAAAKEAIQKKLAGGTVKKVESVSHGSVTSYEADVTSKSGKNREVAVNADGSPHKED